LVLVLEYSFELLVLVLVLEVQVLVLVLVLEHTVLVAMWTFCKFVNAKTEQVHLFL